MDKAEIDCKGNNLQFKDAIIRDFRLNLNHINFIRY